MVGDARQLPSPSSSLRFDDATPASPSLSPNPKFDDGPPAVPAEIDPSSHPPLDRRSCSSVCPGSLASACDLRPTAPAPDVVLANHIGSSTLYDAQQCSLPPRRDSNFSSRTRTQPRMHPTTTEATVPPPRAMSLELAASTPSHVIRLTGPNSRYEHTSARPLRSLRDSPTDDVSHSHGPQPRMTPPIKQFPANRSHSSSKSDKASTHDPPSLSARDLRSIRPCACARTRCCTQPPLHEDETPNENLASIRAPLTSNRARSAPPSWTLSCTTFPSMFSIASQRRLGRKSTSPPRRFS